MITVISPAKRLDETPRSLPAGLTPTEPAFAADAAKLARIARALSVDDLRALMDISEPLARLNRDRFKAFCATPDPQTTKPAAFCFDGDTYAGLEARTLDPDALLWAQDHLRILSGLFGLLRPLDLIQPYRLEMGSRLANPKGPDLYAFWGTKLARALNAAAADAIVGVTEQDVLGRRDHRLQRRAAEPVDGLGAGGDALGRDRVGVTAADEVEGQSGGGAHDQAPAWLKATSRRP